MSDNAPNPPVLHQAFQAFPRIDSPLVDTATGYITQPWHRLLIRLWQMVGGSGTTLQGTAIAKVSADGSTAMLVDVATGQPVGSIGLPAPSTPQAAIESLVLLPLGPTDPQVDFSPQLVMAAPAEPQRDFSPQVIMMPPPEPLPDPLLVLALNPLAGLSP